VTSCLVGEVAAGSIIPEKTLGTAGIYGPADGIIAQGTFNQVEMIIGEIKFAKIHSVRRHGQVHNFSDVSSLAKPKIISIFV
jgi:predicted amidohydrolase